MAAHRYWRVFFYGSTTSGASRCVSELEMRTSVGGSNVATGGTASASSILNATYAAAKAFDGSHASGNGWISATESYSWLKYDFGAGNEKDIAEIKMYTPDSSGGSLSISYMPTSGIFQYSDDDVAWEDYWHIGRMEAAFNKSYVFNASTSEAKKIALCRQYNPATKNIARKTPFTGAYRLSGVTTNEATPAPRRVCLLDQASKQIVDTTFSKDDGLFEFDCIANREYTVIGVDDSGAQNDVVFSRVTPVPR